MTLSEKKELSPWMPRNSHVISFLVFTVAIVHPTVMGYDSMMISSILNLKQYTSYFNLTPATIGLNTAGTWMGEIICNILINSYFSELYGRKPTILLGIMITFVGVILQTCSQNIGMFVVARMFLGGGSSVCLVAASSLVSELADPRRRGFLTGLCFTGFGLGGIFSSIVTFTTRNLDGTWAWRVPSLCQGFFSLIALFTLFFIPESPQYLLAKGNELTPAMIISIVRDIPMEDASDVVEAYRLVLEREKEKSILSWLRFRNKGDIRRFGIFVSQAIITELGGSSVGSYFFSILLQSVGVTNVTQKLEVNIVMSIWSLLIAGLGAFFFDKIGRQKQALISLAGMIVSFYILGGLIKKFGSGYSKSGSYGAVAMMFIFTGFYSFTYQPLTMAYAAEISPFNSRSSGVAIFSILNASFGLIGSFVLPIAMDNIGWKFYIINASYDIILLPIVYFLWVETKNMELNNANALFDVVVIDVNSDDRSAEEVTEEVSLKT